MSELPKNPNPARNLPSTYQEVLRHTTLLDDEVMPIINLLKNTILNPGDDDGDSRSDVVIDDDGNMKVLGVTVVTQYISTDLKPEDYVRDVTYELKDAAVIGLAGKPGVSLRHVTLKTVNVHDKPDGVNYPAWQCAYGDDRMEMYYRQAVADKEWGPWQRVVDLETMFNAHPELVERFSHRQILESAVLPTTQNPGDYWFWPLQYDEDGNVRDPLDGEGEEPPPIIPPDPGGDDDDDPTRKTGYILQNVEDPNDKVEITPGEAANYRFIPLPNGMMVDPGSLKSYILAGVSK